MTAELSTPLRSPAHALSPREFLSLETVATEAGVSLDAAFTWVRTGRLKALCLLGNEWRVERSVLQSFLRGRPASLTVVQPVA